MPREFEPRAQETGIRIDEGGPVALQQPRGRQLAIKLRQFGLVVEQLQMARRAGHEQEDHPLGLRRMVWLFGGQRIRRGGRQRSIAKEVGERHCAQADAAVFQKPAAGDLFRGQTGVLAGLAVHGKRLSRVTGGITRGS